MDSLAYAQLHSDEWDRLDALSREPRLTGAESDELVRLYQVVSGHLSSIRTTSPDPELILRLSAILGRARSRMTIGTTGTLATLAQFFGATLPIAFYRIRWLTLGFGALFCAIFAITLAHFAMNPDEIGRLGPMGYLEQYASEDFVAYYRDHDNHAFAGVVWTNNAWIAIQAIAGGITGILPVAVLVSNAEAVGQSAAVLEYFGELDTFFIWIAPHGLLELTAIFVACAAGFRLFWVLLMPGDLPRREALATEGRQTGLVAVGLVVVLLVSGMIEGFVTPSTMVWWLKIVIGAVALVAFWAWVVLGARSALKRGFSADESRDDVGWTVAYSA